MTDHVEDDLTRTAHAWDQAMVGSDADAISRYMADDWTIIGSDGAISGKVDFLALIRSGVLTHNEMSSAASRTHWTTAQPRERHGRDTGHRTHRGRSARRRRRRPEGGRRHCQRDGILFPQ